LNPWSCDGLCSAAPRSWPQPTGDPQDRPPECSRGWVRRRRSVVWAWWQRAEVRQPPFRGLDPGPRGQWGAPDVTDPVWAPLLGVWYLFERWSSFCRQAAKSGRSTTATNQRGGGEGRAGPAANPGCASLARLIVPSGLARNSWCWSARRHAGTLRAAPPPDWARFWLLLDEKRARFGKGAPAGRRGLTSGAGRGKETPT
jgi:hypothetical protein